MLAAASTSGADTRASFDALVAVYGPVAGVVFLVVLVALLVPLWRNRESRGGSPSQRESSIRLEAGYAVLLGIVAGLLVWRTFEAVSSVDAVAARTAPAPGAPASGLTVGLLAAKWNWRFTYPGGVVVQGDTPNHLPTLVLPAGQDVRFRLRSVDVVHAFWVPAVRYKYDAIPGRTNVFDIAFPAGLDYSDGGRCSEFCGEYHEQMRFRVDVRSPAAFDAWLRTRQAQVGGA